MPGYLDPAAPSISAEYVRYLDGDLLGKLVVRSLLINRLGYAAADVFTPIGRYGDAHPKYANTTAVTHDPGDGHIQLAVGRITFEVKCARVNIANRSRGATTENWAFVNLVHSPGKTPKSYDVLVAVGVYVLGLEDHRYWEHLASACANLTKAGHSARIDALPHEEPFLSLCSFFVIARKHLPANYFRVNVVRARSGAYGKYQFWGYEHDRAKSIWTAAAAAALDGV